MRQNKKQAQQAQQFENVQVSAENFSVIREALKQGKQISVNGKVTLIGYKTNTQHLSDSGKVVRTPFLYLTLEGKELVSYQLKKQLGIEAETKGERKETTFSSVWEQLEKLADSATAKELQDAAKVLQEKAKAKAKAEAEAKAKKIAELEAQLAALRG